MALLEFALQWSEMRHQHDSAKAESVPLSPFTLTHKEYNETQTQTLTHTHKHTYTHAYPHARTHTHRDTHTETHIHVG